MNKKIKGYENYLIYDNGDVLNLTTNKILKGSIGENGYKYYRLSKNNVKTRVYAHRLVAEEFLNNPDNLPIVNHIDGNKMNNSVDNLEWSNYSDNVVHAYENNLIAKRKKSEYYNNDLEDEIWIKIPEYDYSISNYGRVRNDKTYLLLSGSLTSGYLKVRLSNQGKVKDYMVHRLVFCCFNNIKEIPDGYIIDHIDANKTNNKLNNLRMITLSENVLASLYDQKTNLSCKEVGQYTLDGKFLQKFSSCAEAARILKLDSSTISKVCRGINKTHGGYVFKYL